MSKKEYPKWLYHREGERRVVQSVEEHKALGEGWAESPAEHAEFSGLMLWAHNELSKVHHDCAQGLATVVREKESWQVPVLKCMEPAGRTYFLFPPSANVRPGDFVDWIGGERWVVVSPNNMRNRITVEVRQITPVPPEVRVADAMTPEDEFDDLLPLYRRKVFDSDVPMLVAQAQAKNKPLSLLMVDLDNFKAVNDTHGHRPVGDEVLIEYADILKAGIEGKGGKAYRLGVGADEVAILLPNFSLIEGEAVAERLRKSVENSTVSSKALKVTVSIGVACLPDHADNSDSLFQCADKAMYQAKKLGRNLVRVSGEPEEVSTTERKVERRQPSPGKLTDEEKEAIRRTYLTSGQAECPRDGIPLRFIDVTHMGLKTPEFIVSCPNCGLEDHLPRLPADNE